MSPEVFKKWQQIVESVDKTRIPVEFIKKLVVRLPNRKQKTINIKSLFNQGLDVDEVEQVVTKRLEEYDDLLGVEFILDIEGIAEIVQHSTNELLWSNKL